MRHLNCATLALFLAYFLLLEGCAGETEEVVEERALVSLVSVEPPSGSTIKETDTITLTFDGVPEMLKSHVIGGPFPFYTKTDTYVISDPFFGSTVLPTHPDWDPTVVFDITWRDGSIRLFYTVMLQGAGSPRRIR